MRKIIPLPDGKKICAIFGVAYEAYMTSGKFKGNPEVKVNFTGLSHNHYSGRVGVWRLMEMFERYGVRGSFVTNGHAVELWPDAAQALAKAGHEVAAHGYTNEVPMYKMTPEEEREDIAKTTRLIEDCTGVRPVGWASPGNMYTAHTLDILADNGYVWSGDPIDDDNPYVVTVNGGKHKLCVVPKFNYANDFRSWAGGLMCGDDFFLGWKTTFDYLVEQALRSGKTGTLSVVCHAELGGRPHMAYAVNKMLKVVKEYEELVWTPTRRQLAEHCLKNAKEAETFVPAP
jgi:peptidoglycan/xylan/chitin deacetylase (PgdA/CDA1 family)